MTRYQPSPPYSMLIKGSGSKTRTHPHPLTHTYAWTQISIEILYLFIDIIIDISIPIIVVLLRVVKLIDSKCCIVMALILNENFHVELLGLTFPLYLMR